ncbi:MAG: zf-TFIIB domain-containing protein, partial [Cyanobacteria bacterium HKST-UBA01]|nr:zf-TFIIB domain-containing protein [Cyanobacteria bacterium HKST-UBA01]
MSERLACPACNQDSLEPFRDEALKLEIDRCQCCNGLWFDGEELSRFLQSRQLAPRL